MNTVYAAFCGVGKSYLYTKFKDKYIANMLY